MIITSEDSPLSLVLSMQPVNESFVELIFEFENRTKFGFWVPELISVPRWQLCEVDSVDERGYSPDYCYMSELALEEPGNIVFYRGGMPPSIGPIHYMADPAPSPYCSLVPPGGRRRQRVRQYTPLIEATDWTHAPEDPGTTFLCHSLRCVWTLCREDRTRVLSRHEQHSEWAKISSYRPFYVGSLPILPTSPLRFVRNQEFARFNWNRSFVSEWDDYVNAEWPR